LENKNILTLYGIPPLDLRLIASRIEGGGAIDEVENWVKTHLDISPELLENCDIAKIVLEIQNNIYEHLPFAFTREIKKGDLKNLDPEKIPYGYLYNPYKGMGIKGIEECYSQLEIKDPDNFRLIYYFRKKEVKKLIELLKKNNLVILIGMPTSGKTNFILGGISDKLIKASNDHFLRMVDQIKDDYMSFFYYNKLLKNIYFKDNIPLRKNIYSSFFVLGEEFNEGIGNKLYESIIESGKRNIIILDEFDSSWGGFVEKLLKESYKVVICLGGNASNSLKRESIFNLGEKLQNFKIAPILELGIKPLNKTQLKELLEYLKEFIEKFFPSDLELFFIFYTFILSKEKIPFSLCDITSFFSEIKKDINNDFSYKNLNIILNKFLEERFLKVS